MSPLNELFRVRGRHTPDPGELEISGMDPVMDSKFRLGEVAAAAHASVGVGVNDIWELKPAEDKKLKFP